MSKLERGRYAKSCLQVRNGRYRYRRAIPHRLQELEGKSVWVHELGLLSKPAANALAANLTAHYIAHAERLDALPAETRAEILAAPQEMTNNDKASFRKVHRLKPTDKIGALPAWRYLAIADHARATVLKEFLPELKDATLANLPDDEKAPLLLRAHKAEVELARADKSVQRRARVINKLAGKNTDEPQLAVLIDLWQKIKRPKNPKTVAKAHLYVDRFKDWVADLAPNEVTTAHADQFREVLETRAITKGTANLHLEKLSTLFNIARAKNAYGVTTNPFQGVRALGAAKETLGKEPFSPAQVRAIFKACASGSEFEIVAHVLAHHGARSSEICQLTCDDITKLYGVNVMRIHARNGRVKENERDIPIHPACFAAIKKQRDDILSLDDSPVAPDGSRWLFPKSVCLRPDADRGHDYQLEFGRFLRGVVKIADKRLSLHSFRHTFRDLCREAEMPEHISAVIMGHELGAGHHGATYGKGVSLKSRAAWIKKIDPLKT